MNDHEFVRYVQRMIGRKIFYQALCSCTWRSTVNGRAAAWSDWNCHRHTETLELEAGLKQALTGQEP